MKKRAIIGILGLICFLSLLCAAGAEQGAETVTGYFRENKFLRPKMEPSRDVLDTIPGYTVVTVRPIANDWGETTSERGITGYIYYKDILPLPKDKPCTPYAAYCAERQALRTLPEGGQQTERRLEASTLITVDGVNGSFLHVTLPDGEAGYVPKSTVSRAVFKPKKVDALLFCVGEEADALEMPLFGAAAVFPVTPGTAYRTEAVCGDFYVLRGEDGAAAYVWKGIARKWSATDTAQQSFFQKPVITGKRGNLTPEAVYGKGLVNDGGAELLRTAGEAIPLSAGESVYVYAAFGGFYGVRGRQVFGYVRQADVTIPDRAEWVARILNTDLSGATITRNEYLDQALPLLEEGNAFLLRYNAITGADLEPVFPLGVPYFWGGRSYAAITERWPGYTVREDWQDSSGGHYLKGHFYVYGFDCIGLVKHVCAKSGHRIVGDSVSGLGADAFCLSGHHIWCSARNPLPDDWAEAAAAMEIGDILLLHYPGTHAMMYIGTLRDYGYTEEQLPALAGALDYPLMIQSGSNPYCFFRFKNFLDQEKTGIFAKAEPPDGGASVCILGLGRDDAEMIIEYMDEDTSSACFEVEGTCITTLSFRNVRDYFIYRETAPVTEKAQEEPVEAPAVPEDPEEAESAEAPEEAPAESESAEDPAEPEATEMPLES